MAAGLSALLTDVPSNLEWIVTGENGQIVPRGDDAALAEAVLALAADPDRNARYGRRNLEIVRARGTGRGISATIEDIYQRLAIRSNCTIVSYTQTPYWESVQRLDAWLVRQ